MMLTKADIETYIKLQELIENRLYEIGYDSDNLDIGGENSSYREYGYDSDYETIIFPTWHLYGSLDEVTADQIARRERKRLEVEARKERERLASFKHIEDKERAELERLRAKYGESQ